MRLHFSAAECLKKLAGDDNLSRARYCLQEAMAIAVDYHGADQAQHLDFLKKALQGVGTASTPATLSTT